MIFKILFSMITSLLLYSNLSASKIQSNFYDKFISYRKNVITETKLLNTTKSQDSLDANIKDSLLSKFRLLKNIEDFVVDSISMSNGPSRVEIDFNVLIDKMEKAKKNNNQEELFSALSDIAVQYYYLLDYDKAFAYYDKLCFESTKFHNKPWMTFALEGMGTSAYMKGKYELALTNHLKSLEIHKDLGDNIGIIKLLYLIGADYINIVQYDKAIEYFLNLLKLTKPEIDQEYRAFCYHAMGIIYNRLKNFKDAIKYNKAALTIAEKNNKNQLVSNILLEIGEIYYYRSEYDTSMFYLQKSLKIHELHNNIAGMASTLDMIGNIYVNYGLYAEALEYHYLAWQFVNKINEKHRRTRILKNIGSIYTKLKKYDLARSFLTESFNSAKELKTQDILLEIISALSEYYTATNNYQKAHEYLMEFSQLRDSITTQSSHNIAEMQMRYEKGKQEKEKQILLDKIHIQDLELERNRLERWLTALSFVLFLIISFWGYSRFQVKKRANIVLEKRINQAMKDQKEQQKIIFHQASLSSLGELAASMAHEINQPLQDLKLCAEYVELYMRESGSIDKSLLDSLEEIYLDIERIKQIVDHVRTFSSQQKNDVNEMFNVNTVIDDALSMIGKQSTKHGIALNLDLKKNIGKIKGNPYKLEQVLINVLSNAKDALLSKDINAKELTDKQIIIQTFKEADNTIIEISDNGVGIKAESMDKIFKSFYTTKELGEGTGLGLSIVQEIIKEFEGEISINSEYMKETTVKICLPRYIRNSKRYKKIPVFKSENSKNL